LKLKIIQISIQPHNRLNYEKNLPFLGFPVIWNQKYPNKMVNVKQVNELPYLFAPYYLNIRRNFLIALHIKCKEFVANSAKYPMALPSS